MENKKIYENLKEQSDKVFRHMRTCGYKTRERYKKAMERFMVFLADKYRSKKLANIAPKHIFAYVDYMQKKGNAVSTVKTELTAIRTFHDSMPYTRYKLPTNKELNLDKRKFGGVDRTWTNQEFNNMVAKAMESNREDFVAILVIARYAGLRLEECFRIDTNDAYNAIESGQLFVKGKGGLTRYVPVNESIRIEIEKFLKITKRGHKLFVEDNDKTHLAMKRLQCFISYHRKAFTENQITFHGLRRTYAHEKYDEFIQMGKTDFEARKVVSELLGHHRDDVTRIYLAGDEDA